MPPALVGTPFADGAARTDQGAAYVFARDGAIWAQQRKLTTVDGSENDVLGVGVGLSGATALLGAAGADVGGIDIRGSVYAFVFVPDPTPTATATPTLDPNATATPTPTATLDPNVTPTATPTFVPCKTIKPKVKAKLRKGTRTADLTIDPKSFARPCAFARATVDWGDGQAETIFSPTRAHTYANPGPFTLNVQLTDTGGHVNVPAKPKKLKIT